MLSFERTIAKVVRYGYGMILMVVVLLYRTVLYTVRYDTDYHSIIIRTVVLPYDTYMIPYTWFIFLEQEEFGSP